MQQNQIGGSGPDARRMRKAIFRRTIDYNASIMNYLKDRIYYSSSHARRALQPDYLYNYLVRILNDTLFFHLIHLFYTSIGLSFSDVSTQ